jgi:hypothetical protein
MASVNVFAATLIFVVTQIPLRPGFERPPLRTGTSTISGRVIDAVTDKPVADAEVQLIDFEITTERTASSIRRLNRTGIARTDVEGTFSFENIASGSYRIFVTSKTHLPACLGSSRQLSGPCNPIEIDEGKEYRDADVFARPAAIIKGRVVDHEGVAIPLASARVTWSGRDERFGLSAQVIDGHFEIGGLEPGTVTLSVEMPGKRGEGMVRAYYPGTLKPDDALPLSIDVGPPTEVEIRVPRIMMGSLNAHVSGPEGFRLDKLTLTRPDAKMLLPLTREDDGVAHVINLREGRYVIEARGTLDGRALAAFATADIADGATEISIELVDAGIARGRVVAERGGLPPLSGVRVAAVWMQDGLEVDPMRSDEIVVGSDGAFSFNGLFGTRVFQVSGLDGGWQVASIRAGRTEIGSQPFEVAGGSRTELTITVERR